MSGVWTTCKVFESTYSSGREFQDTISSARQRASEIAGVPLEIDRIIFTGSNMPMPSAQQRLGNQDISVITHPAVTITSLLTEMQGIKQREARQLKPRLRNTSTQILLHAAGQTEFRGQAADCDYYRQLGADHGGVRKISEDLHVQPRRFIDQAEAIIKRRNESIHPISLAMLDEEVDDLQQMITPELQQLCKWECDVVLHYDEFKAAFPDCFQAQAPQRMNTPVQV